MGFSESVWNAGLFCLWNLLHFIISLYSGLIRLVHRLDFTDRFLPGYKSNNLTERAESDAKKLPRFPTHLGFVFSEDPQSFTAMNIAELITWCSGFGIPFVSVYDRHGFWSSRKKEIQSFVDRETGTSPKSFPGSCIQIVSSDEKSSALKETEPVSSGFTVPPGTTVVFLTERDGKAVIATAASDICEEVRRKRLEASSVDQGLVDSFIRRGQIFPDPDLVIKIGSLDSLAGFLPWHVRLTEIVFSPSRTDLSYRTLWNALRKFSQVEQRVGR